MFARKFLTSLLCQLSAVALAQTLSLPFERLTIEDGLPNPSVLNIMQDRQGFMWFGTANGIARYDGYEMQVYRPADGPADSLPERDIPRLFQDKSGRIWAGLWFQKTKLFYYDPATDQFQPFPLPEKHPDFYSKPISAFMEDREGRLWFGTLGNGLFRLDLGAWKPGQSISNVSIQHYVKTPHESCNEVNGSLYEDADGQIWFPTDIGLFSLNPKTREWKAIDLFGRPYSCTDLIVQAPHTLWIGTYEDGLLAFNLRAHTFKQYKHDPNRPFGILGNAVYAMARDHAGRLWLYTDAGLERMEANGKRFFRIRDSRYLSEEGFAGISDLYVGYSGNIWVGGWRFGVFRHNPDKGRFQLFRHDIFKLPVSESHVLQQLFEDSRRNIWITTLADGLVRWNRQTGGIRQYNYQAGNSNSLSSNSPWGVVEDRDGFLVAGNMQGLDRIDPHTGTVRRVDELKGQNVSPWKSSKNEIWLHLNNNKLFRWDKPAQPAQAVYAIPAGICIKEDENGTLWIGVNQNGFYRLDPATGSLNHYFPKYGVHDIHFDRYGQCWLLTHSYGLLQFDRSSGRLVPLDPETHQALGLVRAVQEDDRGFLWMVNPQGIVQFDPKTRRMVRQFSKRNWLNPEETWFGINPKSLKTAAGELLFTTPAGLLVFNPADLRVDTIAPKVAFTGLKILNKTARPGLGSPLKVIISQTRHIELKHWQNNFSCTFAALHFKSPEENTYQYRLDPYEKTWKDAGLQREAAYTNLSPGRYTLWVRAANCDGVFSQPVTLSIRILPPWWATWWAWLLYILATGALLYALRTYELRRKLAQAEAQRLSELDAVKTRLYTNITHEFRTPLTIIIGLTEQLKAQVNEGAKTGLDVIRRNGRQLLNLVNQMLDLARVESGHLKLDLVRGDVVLYLRYLLESFHSLATGKNIRLHVEAAEKAIDMDYDPERLQTIVWNLLSNAIKFTPQGGEIWLRIGQAQLNGAPALQFSVRDTGPGIPADKLARIFDRFYQADDSATRAAEGTGIGLTLTRELVHLMGGKITADSEPGQGATFTVLLPITRQARKQAKAPGDPETESAVNPPTLLPAPDRRAGIPEPSQKPLILIIEDNRDVVAYLRGCLQEQYALDAAYDGEQGIAQALEQVPDLIISDVMMPRKDGFEVCHTLKTDSRTSHIPIILLTAKADIDSKIAGLKRGADAYLAKPFHREELLVRIANLLEVRRKLHAYYLHSAGLAVGDDSAPIPPADPGAALEQTVFLQQVKDLIEADFQRQWAVPELAEALFVSVSQLHRKLDALSGMHTTKFVRRVRLTRACAELRARPKDKISAIAYDVGFSNPQEFSRRFREVFGVSPGAWRKKLNR